MEKTLLELLQEKGIPTTDPTNTMIADAATSVAPAILSLLGGSDTTSVNRQFAKGNQYLSTRGDQEAEAIKNMKQIDVNGMPVNVKPVDALYQQDYEKKKLTEALGKTYAPRQYKHIESGKIAHIQNIDGMFVDHDTKLPIAKMSDYMLYQPDHRVNAEDIKGNKFLFVTDPITGETTKVPITSGLGSYYDTGTKGQAENIEDMQKKGSTDVYDLNKQIGRFEQVETELQRTKDPRVAGSLAYGIARDIEPKGVLTDNDVVRILGMDRMTYLERFNQAIAANVTGDVQKYTQSFKALVRAMKEAKRKEIEMIQGVIPKGGPKSKAPKGNQVAPAAKPSNANKARYVELEKSAKSKIKDPATLKRFLEKKRLELGL